MKKNNKAVLITLLILIFLTFGSAAYINSQLNKMDRNSEAIDYSKLGISEGVEKKLDEYQIKITNIALFGIDNVNGEQGRSDTIIIVSIDKTHNMLKLTSIMRDSYVTISGHGKDKINHAYAYGGPQLAIKTLNENFHLNITKYVTVNFTDLSAIIDKLGGIKLKVTDAEASEIPGLETGGTYQLTGAQALAYSRIRCLKGGDYERTLRQRILLEKLYSMLISRPVTQYPAIAGEILPMVKTNLTNMEMITYCTYITTSNPQLKHTRFPRDGESSGKYINGIYYLVFQEQETVDAMQEFIFGASS